MEAITSKLAVISGSFHALRKASPHPTRFIKWYVSYKKLRFLHETYHFEYLE